MNTELKKILQDLKDEKLTVDEAATKIKQKPFEDIGYAKVDLHRKYRQGISEVIYSQSKTAEQIVGIAEVMKQNGQKLILMTRLSKEKAKKIKEKIDINYFEEAKIGVIGEFPKPDGIGKIVVATAGTSDINVAEEAVITAMAHANEVERLYDVGVAGLHRLLSKLDILMSASVVIVIAGMEGALASVIGGIVDCPVIAVPTSVGYGTALNGVTALLSMLNSCASGVSVVNIDNGFGAGYMASMINHMEVKK